MVFDMAIRSKIVSGVARVVLMQSQLRVLDTFHIKDSKGSFTHISVAGIQIRQSFRPPAETCRKDGAPLCTLSECHAAQRRTLFGHVFRACVPKGFAGQVMPFEGTGPPKFAPKNGAWWTAHVCIGRSCATRKLNIGLASAGRVSAGSGR